MPADDHDVVDDNHDALREPSRALIESIRSRS